MNSRHCLDHVHRLCMSAVVAVFALLQVLVPLLHTHVSPSGASVQAGIHLPVTLVHEGHGHGDASLSNAVALDEANAITAPPEHRRDETLAGERTAHAVSVIPTGSLPAGLAAARQAAVLAVPRHGYLPHPPAQAPPASA
jgi:hypothetical protein